MPPVDENPSQAFLGGSVGGGGVVVGDSATDQRKQSSHSYMNSNYYFPAISNFYQFSYINNLQQLRQNEPYI